MCPVKKIGHDVRRNGNACLLTWYVSVHDNPEHHPMDMSQGDNMCCLMSKPTISRLRNILSYIVHHVEQPKSFQWTPTGHLYDNYC